MFLNKLNQEISSINLLPQSPEMLLTNPTLVDKVLRLKLYLVNLAIEACEAFFIKMRLSCFDPHVGDTLCQIRGYMFLWLSKFCKNYNWSDQVISLKCLSSRIGELLVQKKIYIERFRYIKLEDFLEENELSCNISEFVLLLTESFLLSQFKLFKKDENLCIDYSRLMSDLVIPKSLTRKLIHTYQVDLSEKSTLFIIYIIKRYDKVAASFTNDHLTLLDDENRIVTPCYLTMRYIYEDLLKYNINILVVITRKMKCNNDIVCMLFKPHCKKYSYHAKPERRDINKNCFIIRGEASSYDEYVEPSRYVKQFLKVGLEQLIFANMASHPQYSGMKLKEFSSDPYALLKDIYQYDSIIKHKILKFYNDYQKSKNVSEKRKCNVSFPHFFFIRHIYCSVLRDSFFDFNNLGNIKDKSLPTNLVAA